MTEAATTTTEGETASAAASNQGGQTQSDGGQSNQGAAQQQADNGQQINASTQGQNDGGENGQSQNNAEGQQQPGAPEKYDFKAPEGQPAYDEGVISAFSEAARELNLTQDSAQKVIDKVVPVMQARQAEQFNAMKAQWADQAKTDTEFGGDNFDQNMAVAKQALDKFGSEGLTSLLNDTGFGNHPEWIRFTFKVGQALSEEKVFGSGSTDSGEPSIAQRMFPNMNP